ncbi:hypothetical protein FISHEDRAFT_33053, partial [Fistulina hepatica ATCC 64428]
LIADQPWKVLVAVTFLNVTAGRVSIPVFWRVMDRWSTAEALAEADEDEVFVLIRHLGLGRTRARRIIELSQEYLKHPPDFNTLFPTKSTVSSTPNSPSKRRRAARRYPPTPVSHLPGLGAYALDSFRISCTLAHDPTSQEWKLVRPNDKELVRYLKWKWAAEEGKIWSPEFGVVGDVTDDYIDALCTVLEYTAYSPSRTNSSDEDQN